MAIVRDGAGRWCEACGHEHGPLYECSAYHEAVLVTLRLRTEQRRAQFLDREWVQARLDEGMDPAGLVIMAAFFGVTLRFSR